MAVYAGVKMLIEAANRNDVQPQKLSKSEEE